MKGLKNRGITINTDASFYKETQIGGYAYYVVCDSFKIMNSGIFKKKATGPTECEIMAIGNSLAATIHQLNFNIYSKLNWVVINTDSKEAIRHISNPTTPLAKIVNSLSRRLLEILDCNELQFRHVKAHSGINNPRSYVNRWCDRNCRSLARKEHLKRLEEMKQSISN